MIEINENIWFINTIGMDRLRQEFGFRRPHLHDPIRYRKEYIRNPELVKEHLNFCLNLKNSYIVILKDFFDIYHGPMKFRYYTKKNPAIIRIPNKNGH